MDSATIRAAGRHFKKKDRVMSQLISEYGELVLPKTRPPHFHALVSAIINQQLSIKAGRTIEGRVLEKQGGRYFSADRMALLDTADLRQCGLSGNKTRYIESLAQAVLNGELNFRSLAKQNDDSVRETLESFPGIGRWSADIFLIMSMQRPDVFPVGDLVLRKCMQRHYALADDLPHDGYLHIAEDWRPYRSIASYYLWKTH